MRFNLEDSLYVTGTDLGACCQCENRISSGTFLLLPYLTDVIGTGWGCSLCFMPANGAISILCNDCYYKLNMDAKKIRSLIIDPAKQIKNYIVGNPHENIRKPTALLRVPYVHNYTQHAIKKFQIRESKN